MKKVAFVLVGLILASMACSTISKIGAETQVPAITATFTAEPSNVGTPTLVFRYEEYDIFCPSENEEAASYYDQGRTAQEQGDLETARDLYLKAIELDPGYCDAMDNLGLTLRKLGAVEEAISWYQKSIEIYPDNTVAHLNLAVAYEIKGLTDKAQEEYQTLIEIDPENPEGYFGIGKLYVFTDREEEAIPMLEKAEELYLKHGSPEEYVNDARYLLGAAYFQLNDCASTHDYMKQVYPAMENDPYINYAIGVCYLDPSLRDVEQARQYIERAQDLGMEIPPEVLQEIQ